MPPATQQHRFHFSSTDTFIGILLSICTLFLTPPCFSNSLSIYLFLSDYPYLLPVCVLLPLQWRSLAAQGVKWDCNDRSACVDVSLHVCFMSEFMSEQERELPSMPFHVITNAHRTRMIKIMTSLPRTHILSLILKLIYSLVYQYAVTVCGCVLILMLLCLMKSGGSVFFVILMWFFWLILIFSKLEENWLNRIKIN